MIRVGIISDTHDLVRGSVAEALSDCDVVIHAGDIASEQALEKLREVCGERRLVVVRGNADKDRSGAMGELRDVEIVQIGGAGFCVVHKKKDLPADLGGARVIVCGHTHKYAVSETDGVLYLNPGSCGKRRFNQDITMMKLIVEGGEVRDVQRIDLPHTESSDRDIKMPEELAASGKLVQIVRQTMKLMDKGRTPAQIGYELGISAEFAEQICRIRVTHPGVTAEGIAGKIEVNKTVGA